MSESSPALRVRDLAWPLAVCVGLRALIVAGFLGLDVLGDEAHYLRVGGDLDRSGTLAGMWAPLYPALIAGFHRVFGDHAVDAMRVFHVAASAWTCVWVAVIAARVGGRSVGRVAAWILAVYVPHAGFSALLMSEVVFLALLAPTLDLLLRLAIDGRYGSPWWRSPLAGALMGVCALTRESALIHVVLCAAWVAFALRDGAWRPALAPAASFVLAAAVVIAPWSVRNLHYFERFVPIANSTGGSSVIGWNGYDVSFDFTGLSSTPGVAPGELRRLIRGAPPPAWERSSIPNRADRARSNVRSGLAFASAHPGYFVRSRVVEVIDFLAPTSFLLRAQRQYEVTAPLDGPLVRRCLGLLAALLFPLVALLALRGWVRVLANPHFGSLTLVIGLATCSSFAVNGLSRYRMPFLPLMIVLAALALRGEPGAAVEAPALDRASRHGRAGARMGSLRRARDPRAGGDLVSRSETDTARPSTDAARADHRRRERWALAALATTLAAVLVLGFSTVPTDQALLLGLRQNPDPRARARAMAALVHRGYWDERPPAEFRAVIQDAPDEVTEYIRHDAAYLMKRR